MFVERESSTSQLPTELIVAPISKSDSSSNLQADIIIDRNGSAKDDMSDQCSLTQAGLEEYNIRASSYYDQPVLFHHQKQSSYAQSEGYHSYVSSSDSSSATPFLDRLRQESDLLSRQSHHWSQNDLSSVSGSSVAPSPTPLLLNPKHERSANEDVDTHHLSHQQQNNSSESTSSTETLKWLGSMSDVSEASHATGYSAISESVSSSQLIVHSSRVLTPKRHHSESVLYLNNDHQQQLSPNSQSPKQQQQHNSKVSPTLSAREHHSPVQLISNHRHSPSYPPVHTTQTIQPYQKQLVPIKRDLNTIDLPKSSLVAATENVGTATPKLVTITPATIAPIAIQTQPLESQQHKSNISVTISNSEAVVTISPQPPASSLVKCDTTSSSEKSITSSAGTKTVSNQPSTASPQSPLSDTHVSTASVSSTSSTTTPITAAVVTSGTALTTPSYRSNHRLFPVSTYTEPIHSNTSHYVHHPKPQYSANLQKPLANNPTLNTTVANTDAANQAKQAQNSPPANWQSVAERINDFERGGEINEPQKYTFIDPSKTHRISNPALKAFQKNAVQSYFERQQQQQQNHLQPQTQSQDNSQQKIYQPHPSHHHLQQQQLLRPHSYQSVTSIKDAAGHQALRNSLPNTYGGNVTNTNPTRNSLTTTTKIPTMSQKSVSSDSLAYTANVLNTSPSAKPPSPAPPPPPPRSRSLMATTLLRRSSSASDYAEFRDQFTTASQEKLQSQSIKNITNAEKMSFNDCGMPPPPPPRARAPITSRRTSSASEYAAMRDKVLLQHAAAIAHQQHHPHQHQHSKAQRTPNLYTSPPHSVLIAPHDDWVPERPPKNPNLRVPSPDLPPPPADIDTSLSDEPLPPPPPEILHRQTSYYEIENIAPLSGNDTLASALSPNRRNSFAGSSTRKLYHNRNTGSTHDMHTKAPPLIPKKPTNIEILQVSRPTVNLVQQSNKALKVLLNGGSHMHQAQLQTVKMPQAAKITSRKRPHNPALITVPPILENQTMTSPVNLSPTSMNLSSNNLNKSSPPPLMPRMLIPNQAPTMLINSKQR
ncbi:protein Shroom-like [Teleopsis dalmanni]|uniref:protein Shroom-like n=1 Tax=Teleopsis dalmanni TaxID=139649 RepID=UPI0018CDCB7C|nr:protein Shroom-like [Teleopsis dalmanni]